MRARRQVTCSGSFGPFAFGSLGSLGSLGFFSLRSRSSAVALELGRGVAAGSVLLLGRDDGAGGALDSSSSSSVGSSVGSRVALGSRDALGASEDRVGEGALEVSSGRPDAPPPACLPEA